MESLFASAMELRLIINAIAILMSAMAMLMTIGNLALVVTVPFIKEMRLFNGNFDGYLGYFFFLSRCALACFLILYPMMGSATGKEFFFELFFNSIVVIALNAYNIAQCWQFDNYQKAHKAAVLS